MGHFERHLRELGERDRRLVPRVRPLRRRLRRGARHRARVAGTPGTTSRPTDGGDVPFFKRAQIAAADLALAGLADPPSDLDRLTLFADNLVPHVLRIDGVLEFDADLVDRIDAGAAARARLARGGRDPRLRAARGRAAGRRAPRARRPPPRSTTCSGTAAPRRATRRTRATAPDHRLLMERFRGAARPGARRPRGLPRPQARTALRGGDPRGRAATAKRLRGARAHRSRPTSGPLPASSPPRRAAADEVADRRAAPAFDLASALKRPGPVVYLEAPRHLGNLGAAIRVAAAADAAAVLTSGHNDPWHPDAIRGAAGLHFALPVARVDALPAQDRPLVAIDPDGDGSRSRARDPRLRQERHGLSEELLADAARGCGSPCAPASPASTSRPPWPPSSRPPASSSTA